MSQGEARLRHRLVDLLPTLVVCGVVCIGIVCLINGARRVGHPFPGFLVADNNIVLSIGRRGWSVARAERMLFAKVIAIGERPITRGAEIETHVATLPIGTPVTYRLRKQADIFTAAVEVQRFQLTDFVALYCTYFITGLCFAAIGWWALRRAAGSVFAARAFFLTCEAIALTLLTGGDVYGPYWFTSLYFTAHCLTPAMLLQFAGSYPEPLGLGSKARKLAVVVAYTGSLSIAILLNRVADDPSLFLPLIYTVYLLVANALLLYFCRLVVALWSTSEVCIRRSLSYALAGLLLSATAAGVIFVVYPALKRPISPIALVAPLGIFPFLTAAALFYAPGELAGVASRPFVRLRLSLLFLGALETAFLFGIAEFWLNNSWKQLIDDLSLNERQQVRVESFLSGHPRPAKASTRSRLCCRRSESDVSSTLLQPLYCVATTPRHGKPLSSWLSATRKLQRP